MKNLLTLKTLVSDLNLGLGFQSHYLTTFNAHGVTIAWKLGEKTNLMELKKIVTMPKFDCALRKSLIR